MKLNCEVLFNSIMTYSADGIVITNVKGSIIKASNSVLNLFGLKYEQIIGSCYLDFISPEDREQAAVEITMRLQGNNIGKPICYHALHADNKVFYLEVNAAPIMDLNYQKTGFVMIFRDVTERKIQEEELAKTNRKLTKLSVTDALTGIANRRYFEDMLKSEYSRHIRMRKELAIIFADIDYFKNYNDHYGHLAGDACIRQIAQVFNEGIFRSCDFATRYGGEEFAIILPDTDIKGALLVAERLRHSIMNLAIVHETSSVAPTVTASFGVASSFCNADGKASDIVSEADKMLYIAKNEGRNRVVCSQRESQLGIKLTPIKWQNDYVSGDSMIDSEHHVLIESINNLLDQTFSPAKLKAHVENLSYEIASHFHNEERIMLAMNYPDMDSHVKEHVKLLSIVVSLTDQYKNGRITIEDIFSFFAYEFLEPHLLRTNRLFSNIS